MVVQVGIRIVNLNPKSALLKKTYYSLSEKVSFNREDSNREFLEEITIFDTTDRYYF